MGRHAVSMAAADTHYRAPGWFTRNVFNRSVAFLTRHGVSVLGSRVLAVQGAYQRAVAHHAGQPA